MSPCRLNGIDELNYLIRLRDLDYFKTFIMSNRVSYRVSMFKAIESGSVKLTDIVRWHHPHPEEQDAEFEALHAAFRGHLSIYQTIQLNQDMEEFNTYRENMFLYHGKLEQVNMAEIDMHDLLSPNIIPVSVCDMIVSDYGHSTCLMTGVLLAYCIHNSDNYNLLETNPNIFIMDMMFQYAICNNNNEKLKQFLVWKYKQTRQHSDYDYRVRKGTFCKRKQYSGKLDMYDHYLAPRLDTGTITTAAASLIGIKKEGKLCTGGDANYADKIDMGNVQLSTDLFAWQSSRMAEYQIDAYFEQVLDYVNRLINQGVELQKQ